MWKLYIHGACLIYPLGSTGAGGLAKHIHAYQKNGIRHIATKRSRNKQGGNSHKSSSGWIPPIVFVACDLADVLDALVGGVETEGGRREGKSGGRKSEGK